MLESLTRINAGIMKAFEAAAVACIIAVIISTSVQVFTRYILGAALIGTEEVARYCFIWASMLGAGICVSRRSHAAVSFLPDRLKGKAKSRHACLVQLFILAAALILIVQGGNMVQVTWNQLSPTLRVPMWLVYLAIPVGGMGILVAALCNIVEIFKSCSGEEGEA